MAKTFIYAYIYGAGDKKLSDICDVSIQEGKGLREKFENSIPALKTLTNEVKRKYRTQGWVKGLDGRKVICRSEHSALNTLIQGGGALLVKQATIIFHELAYGIGFKFGEDYAMVLHVHDEMQFVVHKDKIEEFKNIASGLFNKTKDYFGFKCELAGEIKVGSNWSETH